MSWTEQPFIQGLAGSSKSTQIAAHTPEPAVHCNEKRLQLDQSIWQKWVTCANCNSSMYDAINDVLLNRCSCELPSEKSSEEAKIDEALSKWETKYDKSTIKNIMHKEFEHQSFQGNFTFSESPDKQYVIIGFLDDEEVVLIAGAPQEGMQILIHLPTMQVLQRCESVFPNGLIGEEMSWIKETPSALAVTSRSYPEHVYHSHIKQFPL